MRKKSKKTEYIPKYTGEYIDCEDGTRIRLTEDDVPDLSDDPNIIWTPLRDEFPDLAAYSVARKAKAGRPRKEKKKELVTVRLDPDILAALKSRGRGWQTELNAFLYKTVIDGQRPHF